MLASEKVIGYLLSFDHANKRLLQGQPHVASMAHFK